MKKIPSTLFKGELICVFKYWFFVSFREWNAIGVGIAFWSTIFHEKPDNYVVIKLWGIHLHFRFPVFLGLKFPEFSE